MKHIYLKEEFENNSFKLMEELIKKLFESRDAAHAMHLKTESHAEHIALQGYYEGIVPLVDSLAELWQGKFSKIDISDLYKDKADSIDLDNPLVYFEKLSDDLEAVGEEIKNHSTIVAVLDDVKTLTFSLIYKLRELK